MKYQYINTLGHQIFYIERNLNSIREHNLGDKIKINLIEYKILDIINKNKKMKTIIVDAI